MKKSLLLPAVLLLAASSLFAQNRSCVISGFPITKKSGVPVEGALVTLTDEWDKSRKYQRRVDAEGFEMVVPAGGYQLEITAEGYETYSLQIDVDEPHIDLGMMKMLTDEMAAARDARRRR